MKSNSASKAPAPYGIDDVVRPRGLTYNVTCHQWFSSGASASRVLPTICIHMCSVSCVSRHSASASPRGQASGTSTMVLLPHDATARRSSPDSERPPPSRSRRFCIRPRRLVLLGLRGGLSREGGYSSGLRRHHDHLR